MNAESNSRKLPILLKRLRNEAKLPQRKVAAAIDMDGATYCKIENGKYLPNRDQVAGLADLFGYDRDELVKVWLADKIVELAESDKAVAKEAMQIANKALNI